MSCRDCYFKKGTNLSDSNRYFYCGYYGGVVDGNTVFGCDHGFKETDIVRVVRCKDCSNFYLADNRVPEEQCYVCGYLNKDGVKPDDYCCWGVAKEKTLSQKDFEYDSLDSFIRHFEE